MLGIGLLLSATIFLSSSDVAGKYLTQTVPVVQIIWMRFAAFAGIMLLVVWHGGGARTLRTQRPGLHFLRGLGVIGSTILFVTGMKYLAMADATAISFVSPVFVTALSIPLLGEKVGWRRWLATFVGLAGVMIVVRPGGSGFDAAALLPMISSLCWAFALIVTRQMSTTESPVAILTTSACIGLACISLALPFVWEPPAWSSLAIGMLIGVVSTIGHWLVILAFRHGDASMLAPFQYVQLVWAVLGGYLLFAALPDRWTLVGAAVIAGSGLYIAHRERLRARARLTR